MPFIKVTTNLSKNQLPDNFMNKLTEHVAQTIDRDPSWFNWTFECGVNMSKGVNNERLSYMEIRIEAFDRFDQPSQTEKYVPPIFDFLVSKTCLSKDEIHILLYSIPLWRIGKDGVAMKGLDN